MKPKYNLDKIKFATDKPTFEKAVDLYEKGKVINFQEGIGSYSATVQGTKPYYVSIEARQFGLGGCDCYLGQRDFLCKHMVAVSIYAVMNGKELNVEEKEVCGVPVCSKKLGSLSKEELAKTKKEITSAMAYIKSYNGPSRTWFAYQDSLAEGCARLSQIVSNLPVSEQTAKVLVKLLLRLDKKLCYSGVDDSDGLVGGFMESLVEVLQEYAKLDKFCIQEFKDLCGKETCFGWEDPLVEIYGR